MLVDEELIRETLSKIITNWKGNYQNSDKKDNGSISKKMHALDHFTKCTPI